MEAAQEQKLLELADRQRQPMLEGLFQVLAVNSERSKPAPGAPWGKGPRQALDQALAIAKDLGFATRVVADQVGIAEYAPQGTEGKPYIGIVGHLDVVPAVGDWTSDPYRPEIRDGRIYARGALDNKGPILACLYALNAIRESGLALQRPVRILFGTNEETGMEDIPAYLAQEEPPVAGFTPDCKYPVVYAERGRAVYELTFPTEDQARQWSEAHPDEASLQLAIADPEFGILQLRNRYVQDNRVQFAASYPPVTDAGKILQILEGSLPDGARATLVSDWQPVFYEKHSPLCRILQQAYESVTGLDGTPVTTTGGTYAKRMPGIVPFGPSFPGQKGIAHLPDEWMDVEDLMANLRIYTLAIADLATEELGETE